MAISGIIAQPLSYLSLSLQAAIDFQTKSGLLGKVVSPGSWIFHKGLTFPKRKNKSKVYKDLYGIWYVASQLKTFSRNAITELQFLSKQHPKWQKTFQKNILQWITSATPIDWSNLEHQDPYGFLKRTHFKLLVSKLIN